MERIDKFKEIRPVVLGIAIKDGKLLVSEGYDKVKNQTFYRCLGGGIEFRETSQEALKREFKEEIDAEIEVGDFLDISENIFTYLGKDAHEIVFLYDVTINENDFKEEYKILDENDSFAKWIDVNEFKNNNKILYPEEVYKYL